MPGNEARFRRALKVFVRPQPHCFAQTVALPHELYMYVYVYMYMYMYKAKLSLKQN